MILEDCMFKLENADNILGLSFVFVLLKFLCEDFKQSLLPILLNPCHFLVAVSLWRWYVMLCNVVMVYLLQISWTTNDSETSVRLFVQTFLLWFVSTLTNISRVWCRELVGSVSGTQMQCAPVRVLLTATLGTGSDLSHLKWATSKYCSKWCVIVVPRIAALTEYIHYGRAGTLPINRVKYYSKVSFYVATDWIGMSSLVR